MVMPDSELSTPKLLKYLKICSYDEEGQDDPACSTERL